MCPLSKSIDNLPNDHHIFSETFSLTQQVCLGIIMATAASAAMTARPPGHQDQGGAGGEEPSQQTGMLSCLFKIKNFYVDDLVKKFINGGS